MVESRSRLNRHSLSFPETFDIIQIEPKTGLIETV